MTPPGAPAPDRARLLELSGAYVHARALHLIAEVGVADALADGPRPVAELAAVTRTHPGALHRLLRLLAGDGVVREVDPGVFQLAPPGQFLRSDHPESLRPMLVFQQRIARAYADALHSLRTGRPTFPETFGRPLFEFLRDQPELGRLFDASMAQITRVDGESVIAAYDFSGAGKIVDLAGGDASLLTAILGACPATTGLLFDQPHVLPAARRRIDAAGLADRCDVAGGDLFGPIPPGGDVYLLKWILHDWPDDKAVTILRGCREAMPPGGRLLVIEQLIPPGDAPHPSKVLDIVMLVMLGGRERTSEEYRALLAEAGLTLHHVTQTTSALSILEARPTAAPG
jgi:O-methyltransferase domain